MEEKTTKRYYWLKLKENFFEEKYVRALRKLPQGDSLVIVYLKMQLKSLKTEGIIKYEQILPDAISELSLFLDEDETIVRLTVNALIKFGVIERWNNDTLYMVAMQKLIGSETAGAERVRRHRELKKNELYSNLLTDIDNASNSQSVKTNAERQRAFRAKKFCELKKNVPYVESADNLKRYGGNYYLVMRRDECKCAICGSTENLCVHHIDGYDENKPENNMENKLLVLCRSCHGKVHRAGMPISNDILEQINYFDSNVTRTCNSNVTKCNTEIEIDKEIELDNNPLYPPYEGEEVVENIPDSNVTEIGNADVTQDETPHKRGRKKITHFVKPTEEEVLAYCNERRNGINAAEFVAFYESKGWRVGNQPMKDWKAAVRTWEIRKREKNPQMSSAEADKLNERLINLSPDDI